MFIAKRDAERIPRYCRQHGIDYSREMELSSFERAVDVEKWIFTVPCGGVKVVAKLAFMVDKYKQGTEIEIRFKL